jgi:hypothetical protein
MDGGGRKEQKMIKQKYEKNNFFFVEVETSSFKIELEKGKLKTTRYK